MRRWFTPSLITLLLDAGTQGLYNTDMIFRPKRILLAVALVGAVGCDTMYRAQVVQEEVAAMSSDDGGDVVAQTEFVDLTRFTLPEYVMFALTNRPDVISARLAVSNAYLKLTQITSGEYPILGVSGGYSQSTHNNGPHFSWHQSGDANASFRMELLLYDFGRLDAQELEARENIIAAQEPVLNSTSLPLTFAVNFIGAAMKFSPRTLTCSSRLQAPKV